MALQEMIFDLHLLVFPGSGHVWFVFHCRILTILSIPLIYIHHRHLHTTNCNARSKIASAYIPNKQRSFKDVQSAGFLLLNLKEYNFKQQTIFFFCQWAHLCFPYQVIIVPR